MADFSKIFNAATNIAGAGVNNENGSGNGIIGSIIDIAQDAIEAAKQKTEADKARQQAYDSTYVEPATYNQPEEKHELPNSEMVEGDQEDKSGYKVPDDIDMNKIQEWLDINTKINPLFETKNSTSFNNGIGGFKSSGGKTFTENPSEDTKEYVENQKQTTVNPGVQKELDRREARQRAFNESVTDQTWGQMGFDYTQDPLYQQQVESARTAKYSPTSISNELFNRIDNGNLLGFSAQQKSSDDINKAYESLENIEPTSASADKESRQNFMELPLPDENNPLSNFTINPLIRNAFKVNKNIIDDGRSEESREALYMTGEQYLRYKHELGIPGRPDRLIDPDELYSKQDEMEQYGFIPYIVSDEGLENFHDESAMNKVSNLFNDVSNARRKLTDYEVNYDGETYSGKDLQKNSAVWSKNIAKQSDFSNPENADRQIFDKSQASEFAVPHRAKYYMLDSSTGKTVEHEGEPVTKEEFDDGRIRFTWDDGTWFEWDNYDQLLQEEQANQSGVTYEPTTDDDPLVSMWYEMDPLELDDGRLIRADKANKLLGDVYSADMDSYANYGIAGLGRPFVEDPEFDFNSKVAPWIADIFLGSAPLFYGPTAASQAIANSITAYQGLKPGYQDYLNDTYSLVSQDPREDQRILSTLGNAALPITEKLWGPIGGSIFKYLPITKGLASKVESLPWLAQYGLGVLGEAGEEVPGNIVEEFMNGSGLDWYANPLLDEAGNKVYDEQGTLKYNSSSDLQQEAIDRNKNFWADAPLAMLGGGVVGGTLGLTHIPKYMQNYAENNGNIKRGRSENVTTELTPEEVSYYNQMMSRGLERQNKPNYWEGYDETNEPWYISPDEMEEIEKNMRDAIKNVFASMPSRSIRLNDIEKAQRDADRAEYERFMSENDEKNTKGPHVGKLFADDDKFGEEPINPETGRSLDDEFDDYLGEMDDNYIFNSIIDYLADNFEHRPNNILDILEADGTLDRERFEREMADEWEEYRYGGTDEGYWRSAADRLDSLYKNDLGNINNLRDIAEEYAKSGDVYDWLIDDIKKAEHGIPNDYGADLGTLYEIKYLADTYSQWKPYHNAMQEIVKKTIGKNFRR